jgi:UDP-2,3-diacylglucosamine pyrophosphatase LpxH
MIIGLTGYAQSGKDTLAGMLIGLHKYDNRAFADPIRKLLYETNPLIKDGYRVKTVVDAYGWDKAKVEFPELRSLLQTLGVGARTVFGDQFWVAQGLAGLSAGDKIVITDVRFPNEADAIKALGGQVWRVRRLGIKAVNGHVSETAMDGYKVDQIFINNGSVDDLMALLQARMRQFL